MEMVIAVSEWFANIDIKEWSVKEWSIIFIGLLALMGLTNIIVAIRNNRADYYLKTPNFSPAILRKLALAKGEVLTPLAYPEEISDAKVWFKGIEEDSPDKLTQYNRAYNLHKEIELHVSKHNGAGYEHWLIRSTQWFSKTILKETSTPETQQGLTPYFTTESYQVCLQLAFIYPVFFAFISLPISQQLQIGELILIPQISAIDAWVIALLFPIVGFCFYRSVNSSGWQNILWFAAGVAGVGVAAVADGAAGAVAVAVAPVVAGVAGAAGAAGVAVAAGVAAVSLIFIDRALNKNIATMWLYYGVSNLLFFLYGLATVLLVLIFAPASNFDLLFLPLILIILPLLNAPIDWVSLNITRFLIDKMQQHHHSAWRLTGYAVFDLALAVIFVFVLSALILLVLIAINYLTISLSGHLFIDFTPLMAGLNNQPREYIWILLLVLSTLIPTFLHFILALYSFASWPAAYLGKNAYQRLYHHQSEKQGSFEKDRNTILIASNFQMFITGLFIFMTFVGLYQVHSGIDTIAKGLWQWADIILQWDPAYQSPKSS